MIDYRDSNETDGFDFDDFDEFDELDWNETDNSDDSDDEAVETDDSDNGDYESGLFDESDEFEEEESDEVDNHEEDTYEEDIEIEEDASSYMDGAIIEDEDDVAGGSSLLDDNNSFISDSGDIVVMENTDGENFELKYIDINDIAIVKRIRKSNGVEELVTSIKSTGLLKPIVVAPTATDNIYVLIDGYRRILACARCGIRKIPSIVNTKISTPDIPVLEALYNHAKAYSISEIVDYIDYLEKQKGIMSASMIEYLLQMNSGEYTKLKDILNDDDEDIVSKLYDGIYTIDAAFKKLEQRRKKESAEEKANKRAERVYENEQESGVDQIEDSGESVDEGGALSEEEIANLTINASELDDGLEDESLEDMIKEDKEISGFEPHKQKTGEREYIDPVLRKTVMARDNSTCQCCKRGGEQYVDILDYHHVMPCFLGGNDSVDNGIMLCVSCHRLVHLYSTGDLHINNALMEGNFGDLSDDDKERYQNEEIFEDEKMRFKRIIKLGGVIRRGIAQKGMNREQYKKEHPNTGIGRRLPGKGDNKQTKA